MKLTIIREVSEGNFKQPFNETVLTSKLRAVEPSFEAYAETAKIYSYQNQERLLREVQFIERRHGRPIRSRNNSKMRWPKEATAKSYYVKGSK